MPETDPKDTFAIFGTSMQRKIVQALLQDSSFADQMGDFLLPRYFDLRYLQLIVGKLYEHKQQYKTFPSPEVLEVMVAQEGDELALQQAKEFFAAHREHPLNGDSGFVQATSLDFCKKQSLKESIIKAIDLIETADYDSVETVVKDGLRKGASRDLGHEYLAGFGQRSSKSLRKPIPTGWPVLDRILNGGWERKTLTTFIAPTGAGKSMFLVNVSAAAVAQGLNSLYITCEMADFKIGLRHDSYFSGVPINDVPAQPEAVQTQVLEKAKGSLWVKEFPTKTASVQTIRAYVQRLKATKGFVPDILVVDYADLLRSSRSYGDNKRFELEGVYEELRALAQELNVVLVTADQTNRGGLELEVVTLASIAESYAKATVCDVILTISRRAEDKRANCGRLFIAKSRLGQDGMVHPFVLNTSTVKVSLLEQTEDPMSMFLEANKGLAQRVAERAEALGLNGSK